MKEVNIRKGHYIVQNNDGEDAWLSLMTADEVVDAVLMQGVNIQIWEQTGIGELSKLIVNKTKTFITVSGEDGSVVFAIPVPREYAMEENLGSMYFQIKFDREINSSRHDIMPGGYAMTFAGNTIEFDFETFRADVDKNDRTILNVEAYRPDIYTYLDIRQISKDTVQKLEKIDEFCIYTGESIDPEINPVKLLSLSFGFEDGTIVDCTGTKAVQEFRVRPLTQKTNMLESIQAKVRFDRTINPDIHCLGSGNGYKLVLGGETVNIDFYNFSGKIDSEDKTVLHIIEDELDTDTFPKAETLTKEDILRLAKIEEFSLWTGDYSEPEIYPTELLSLAFRFTDGMVIDCSDMDAVKNFKFR